MAKISIAQAAQYAANAGFSGESLRIIVSIAQAESQLVTNARHTNADGSVDRGILQINSFWHSEVTDAMADDPQQAFIQGLRISSDGTQFGQWTTYVTGAYKNTQAWSQLSGETGTPSPVPAPVLWGPKQSLKTWPWITSDGVTPNINNPYHSGFEASRGAIQDGVGIGVGLDTEVTSLTAGTVMQAAFGQQLAPAGANWNYGGFIIVRSQIYGIGTVDVFYRHMDTLSVSKGDIVAVGQLLGLSGGQTVGGHNPESPVFTTGAHIDVGINPSTLPYQSIGPNMDPTAWLKNLIKNGPSLKDRLGIVSPPAGTVTSIVDQIAGGYGPVADSFTAIEQRLDYSMQFYPIDWSTLSKGTNWWDYVLPWQWAYTEKTVSGNLATAVLHDVTAVLIRLMFMWIGLLIIAAFVFAVFRGAFEASGAEDATKEVAKTAATVGAVAA